jgi:uncharacterized protein (DUF1697 family)
MNAKMPELKCCFETAGFTEVRTLLSSGNVVFSARAASADTLARRAEAAMQSALGRSFSTFVRPSLYLQDLIASDQFAQFELEPTAKRVVTFLRRAAAPDLALPIERDGARILKLVANEVLSAYVPSANGPVFMTLLERTFGKDITTRTIETVRRCAAA